MISEIAAKRYCREDISKIENYEKAKYDLYCTWYCHHRDEIKTLPSGIKVLRTLADLVEADRYFNCPANELIFLTPTEHIRIHQQAGTYKKIKISKHK